MSSLTPEDLPWRTRAFLESKSTEILAALSTIDVFRSIDPNSPLKEQAAYVVEGFRKFPDLGQRVADAVRDTCQTLYSTFSPSLDPVLDVLSLDRVYRSGPVGTPSSDSAVLALDRIDRSGPFGDTDDDDGAHYGHRPEDAVECTDSEESSIEECRDTIAAYIVDRCGGYHGKYGIKYAEQIRDIVKNKNYHFYYTCASEERCEEVGEKTHAFFDRTYGERPEWGTENICESSTMYPRYPHVFFCDRFFTRSRQIRESIIIHELVHFCDWKYDCEHDLHEYANTIETEYRAAFMQAKWLGMSDCEARAFAFAHYHNYGKSFAVKVVDFFYHWFLECPMGRIAFLVIVAAIIALIFGQVWAVAALAAIIGWGIARGIYIFYIE